MRHMAAIPESTRNSITLRLLDHAEQHWPQLDRVQVTCRGGFAYITGVLPGGEQIPLFRLRYGGSAHSFGFAIYSAARAATKTPSCSPGSTEAPPKKHSTPPAPSTSPASARTRTPDELRGHPHSGAAPHPTRRASAWLRLPGVGAVLG